MRLRVALKIRKAIGTGREGNYTWWQKERACNRYDRLRSAREDKAFFAALLSRLGPLGRAWVLARTGRPDMALDLLMRTPEGQWRYGGNPE